MGTEAVLAATSGVIPCHGLPSELSAGPEVTSQVHALCQLLNFRSFCVTDKVTGKLVLINSSFCLVSAPRSLAAIVSQFCGTR
jgi:hypothetical protein